MKAVVNNNQTTYDCRDDKLDWIFQIEFTGLLIAEPRRHSKDMLIQLLDDAMHVPVLAARSRDVQAVNDCVALHKIMQSGTGPDDGATVGVWPIRRAAAMALVEPMPPSKPDLEICMKGPDSVRLLPSLRALLGAKQCAVDHDSAKFHLTHGHVSSGRYDKKLIFKITVGGKEVHHGPLALSV